MSSWCFCRDNLLNLSNGKLTKIPALITIPIVMWTLVPIMMGFFVWTIMRAGMPAIPRIPMLAAVRAKVRTGMPVMVLTPVPVVIFLLRGIPTISGGIPAIVAPVLVVASQRLAGETSEHGDRSSHWHDPVLHSLIHVSAPKRHIVAIP